MKQVKIIEQLKQNVSNISNVEAMLLIGSFGRNAGTYNSDIDLSILINDSFKEETFLKELRNIFPNEVQSVLSVELRKKYVVFFQKKVKLEFNICRDLSEIDKYFLGSEISDCSNCILFDKQNIIENYLHKITNQKQNNPTDIANLYLMTVNKFIYDFEQFSLYHKRSDAYKTYFQYNLALNDCLQLLQLNRGEVQFLYLPNNQNYFHGKEGRERLRRLAGTLYLPEANQLKRELLNLFYETIETQTITENINVEEIKSFLEWVFLRDYGFNFRDISDNSSKIRSGVVYRTSTLTRYQKNEEYFNFILKSHAITTIIDLRAKEHEIEKDPYQISLSDIKIVEAPFDPWNQSEHFKANYNYGSDSEIAYRFFAIECKESIKKIANEIIEQKNGAIAVHCHAGKDRTGCLISLFYLLCGASEDELYLDYFASEADTKKYKIDTFLSEVKKYNTIEGYFLSCGLSENEVSKLKSKLVK
jgi:predicted nucleotidyltransferase